MSRLVIATIVWAFSFSLIGHYIAGKMDIYLAIFIRLVIAFVVFLPFFNLKRFFAFESVKLVGVGVLQIGIMYLLYFNSFKYLSVVEVALFTVATPLYVSILGNLFNKKFIPKQFFNVLLVIVGSIIIKWDSVADHFFLGFLLVQGANLSFALGQVLYKRFLPVEDQKEVFPFFYIGALIPITVMLTLYSDFNLIHITQVQWAVLFWLGAIASGLGYFLWNSGAKLVSYGKLAVMNNAVIPVAILVDVLLWKTSVSWPSFFLGSTIIFSGIFLENRQNTILV